MKKCKKCKKIKTLTEFYKKPGSKDGLDYRCKMCKSKYYKAWSDTHKESRYFYQKEWIEKNRDKYNKYQNEYKKSKRQKKKE